MKSYLCIGGALNNKLATSLEVVGLGYTAFNRSSRVVNNKIVCVKPPTMVWIHQSVFEKR